MKRILLLSIALFSLTIHAQETIDLLFSGIDKNNNYVRIDSVIVKNITRGWSETIFFPDTVYTLEIGTSIEDPQLAEGMEVMPNPFDGQTRVNISSAKDEPVTMVLVDVTGKKCASYSGNLVCGNNFFEISVTTPQVYVLSVTAPSGTRSLKMINKGHASADRIRTANHSEKAMKVCLRSTSSHDFELGDEMQYSGYFSSHGILFPSETVTQQQYTSEDIQLLFLIDPTSLMTVTTDTLTSNSSLTVQCYGTVTTNENVLARGFCWGTLPHPSLANNHSVENGGTGSFSSILAGLDPEKRYYLRAYATIRYGTVYGNEYQFRISQSFTQTDTAFLADGTNCGNGCTYVSSVNINDFSPSDTIQSVNDIGFVRIKIEHSWVGDLWIALVCPNGQFSSILRKFSSSTTTECTSAIPQSEWGWIPTGNPNCQFGIDGTSNNYYENKCNPASNPMGTPWNYVWSDNTNNNYQYHPDNYVYVSSNITSDHRLDSTNVAAMTNVFHPENSFANLIGCPLNGTWSIEVVDGEPLCNGWITEWELAFDRGGTILVTPAMSEGPCPDAATVTDYDGNVYNTVQIGNQCWMRENLRTTHYADGTAVPAGSGDNFNDYVPFYYDYNSSNIPLEARGYHYTWTAVMHGANSSASVPSGVQGICPTGWHVPSDAEWTIMETTQTEMDVSGTGTRGDHASRLAGDYWNTSNIANSPGDANYPWHNASGFSAVPAGNWGGASFFSSGENAFFGSSTGGTGTFSSCRQLRYDNTCVTNTGWYKRLGYSVRCLLD